MCSWLQLKSKVGATFLVRIPTWVQKPFNTHNRSPPFRNAFYHIIIKRPPITGTSHSIKISRSATKQSPWSTLLSFSSRHLSNISLHNVGPVVNVFGSCNAALFRKFVACIGTLTRHIMRKNKCRLYIGSGGGALLQTLLLTEPSRASPP